MKKPLLALSMTCLLFSIAGAATASCSDSSSTDPGGPDAASTTDSAADSARVPDGGATLNGTVIEGRLDDAGSPVPIPGASVCVFTSPDLPCVLTADDGTFSIPGPPGPADGGGFDFAMVATAAGHLGGAGLGDFATTPVPFYVFPSTLVLKSDANAAIWAGQAGFTYPANGTSFIELRLPEGASATLAPASGKGPVYGDATGTPTPALTAATSSRVVWFGNVTPGPFTITVNAPGTTCSQGTAGQRIAGDWLGPTANSLSGVTIGDVLLSGLTMECQ